MEERPAVRVVIFGHEYTIRGEADADYIRTLAQYVDGKMQEIAKNASLNIPLKVSILAAINLADEIFRLRAARPEKSQEPAPAQPAGDLPLLSLPVAETPPPGVDPEAVRALVKHIQDALDEETV